MYWEQGEENLKDEYNKKCIRQWRKLNPTWNVRVLNYDEAIKLIPDFKKTDHLQVQLRSDYLRLALLEKYGGIWADASVYPRLKLDDWLEHEFKNNDIFMYKFDPIYRGKITSSWFIAVSNKNNSLIGKWKRKLEERMPKKDEKYPYFLVHNLLLELYNTDPEVEKVIDNLNHTAKNSNKCKKPAYMWKRCKNSIPN